MKSRMLMSLLVIALAAALVGGATMAWFTDAADTDEVTFAAGTLMIDVDDPTVADKSREDLVLDRLNPGDSLTWEFEVDNVGTKSANWLLYMCWQDIIGRDNTDLPEGQQALLTAREGFGTNGLSEVVQWVITVGGVEVYNGLLPQEGPLVLDNLAPFDALGEEGALRTQTVSVTATLPGEATTNAYQGSKMNIAFGVKAWQTTNDAPKPTVSKEEDCPFYNEPGDEPGEPEPVEYYGTVSWGSTKSVSKSVNGVGGTEVTLTNVTISNAKDADGNLANGTMSVKVYYPGHEADEYTWSGTAVFVDGAATIPQVEFYFPSTIFNSNNIVFKIFG